MVSSGEPCDQEDIRLVFVDGNLDVVEKTKMKVPAAIYTSSATLNQVLSQ